jgi:hypothetical protein
MRAFIVMAIALAPLAVSGCISRTVEERPVQVAPAPAPTTTIIVPPQSTVVCAPGQAC